MLSNLSSAPPCPGRKKPESLMFAKRFNTDSTKSPSVAAIAKINPATAILISGKPKINVPTTTAVKIVPKIEPRKPSTVLPGLIDEASLWEPIAEPIK